MKSLFVLAAIALSSSTQAAPAVGDLVRYKLTVSSDQSSLIREQKVEVLAINAAAGTFTTKTTISFDGTQAGETNENADLNAATDAENTLDHCSEMPANMASIETIRVPAGTFQVCHIKYEQNGLKLDQYMGKVLFGLVKSVSVDTAYNMTTTYELLEVKKQP